MGVPHALPQALEGAELELLHRAFRSPKPVGDLANALLLDEALQDDALLVRGQPAHQIGEHGAAVRAGAHPVLAGFRRPLRVLPRGALPAIGKGISRDLQEPRRERNAAPLEAAELASAW
jgi:hypothetical protein